MSGKPFTPAPFTAAGLAEIAKDAERSTRLTVEQAEFVKKFALAFADYPADLPPAAVARLRDIELVIYAIG